MSFFKDAYNTLTGQSSDSIKEILEQQNYWNDPEQDKKESISIKDFSKSDLKQLKKDIKVVKQEVRAIGIQIYPPTQRALDQGKRRVTSPYGKRYLNINGKRVPNWHIGTDYSSGTKAALAVESLVIEKIRHLGEKPCRFEKRGNTWVEIATLKEAPTPYVIARSVRKKNLVYKYKHVKPLDGLELGEIIRGGMPLGSCGSYGYSMGPHLHFEAWHKGRHLNPEVWFHNMSKYLVWDLLFDE